MRMQVAIEAEIPCATRFTLIVNLAGLAASVDAGEKAAAWAGWGAFAWGALAFFGEADRTYGAVCIIAATGFWGDLGLSSVVASSGVGSMRVISSVGAASSERVISW